MIKLSLNLKKTHFILFRKRKQKVFLSEELIIDNVRINMVDSTKFLGVYIDQNLLFQKHILYIKGKISRGIGILYKCKPVLNETSLKMLYNAIIYPYFVYCIEVGVILFPHIWILWLKLRSKPSELFPVLRSKPILCLYS